ncbi:hypothetical protein, partial [Salmonella enterica]|uniref:hypothetical protein n=1 Tax=Salmonella enterica TaxID=28901 RepID=UPI0032994E92
PYAVGGFRWTPPAGWLWATAIHPLGWLAWAGAHFAAVALLRDWRIVAAVVLAFPFWHDLLNGNVLTFAFVAAWLALRG